MKNILFYRESEIPYGCFSNFYRSFFIYNNIGFKTAEHAFQAYKHIHNKKIFDEIANAPTPTEAKKIGSNRENIPRNDWDEVKVKIMEEIVYAKFTQNQTCKEILMSTGDDILVEHTYNDTYWADSGGNNRGKNMLGKVLMDIRKKIGSELNVIHYNKKNIGKLRVGRMIYGIRNAPIFVPKYYGFTQIFVMIKDDPKNNQYGALSPYSIRVPIKGYPLDVIHENYWQFSKVYEEVPEIVQTASMHNKKIVWVHKQERHLDANSNILPSWFAWNKKGFNCQDYVRFPVGSSKKARSSCKFSLKIEEDGSVDILKKMNYIEARKKIYAKSYCENVIKNKLFEDLLLRLQNGENLLLIEVDGPHQESLPYYQKKYGWHQNTIIDNTIELTVDVLKILINDEKHAFGHGYCLGMSLMEIIYENVIGYICEEDNKY